MIWQDIVIAVVNIIFSYSLVFQVYYGFKQRKGLLTIQTSLLTFTGLYVLTIVFFTLELYLSTIMTGVIGTLWLILFIQRIIYKRA